MITSEFCPLLSNQEYSVPSKNPISVDVKVFLVHRGVEHNLEEFVRNTKQKGFPSQFESGRISAGKHFQLHCSATALYQTSNNQPTSSTLTKASVVFFINHIKMSSWERKFFILVWCTLHFSMNEWLNGWLSNLINNWIN